LERQHVVLSGLSICHLRDRLDGMRRDDRQRLMTTLRKNACPCMTRPSMV
jgi:hypothetical protein